jgi:cytochrome c oxidase subunit 1
MLAALIRLQLAWPGRQWEWLGVLFPTGMESGVMKPEFYLSLVTMHGTIMIFFFVSLCLVSGFGNYLIPLQVGARDMAFPFLNMLSYWTIVPRSSSPLPRSSSRVARRLPGGRPTRP